MKTREQMISKLEQRRVADCNYRPIDMANDAYDAGYAAALERAAQAVENEPLADTLRKHFGASFAAVIRALKEAPHERNI